MIYLNNLKIFKIIDYHKNKSIINLLLNKYIIINFIKLINYNSKKLYKKISRDYISFLLTYIIYIYI